MKTYSGSSGDNKGWWQSDSMILLRNKELYVNTQRKASLSCVDFMFRIEIVYDLMCRDGRLSKEI